VLYAPLSSEEKRDVKEISQDIEKIISDLKNRNKISDENLIKAIMWQESRYSQYAVSPGGAAGLMQIVPETALDLGLKVAMKNPKTGNLMTFEKTDGSIIVKENGKEETINNYKDYMTSNNLWVNCNGISVSPCNSCTKQYCDYSSDERFDMEKSIEAGARHIESLLSQFKGDNQGNYKYAYAIAAYHDGADKIKERCNCNNGICNNPPEECTSNKKYVENVLATIGTISAAA